MARDFDIANRNGSQAKSQKPKGSLARKRHIPISIFYCRRPFLHLWIR
jgi:hypothetical protein